MSATAVIAIFAGMFVYTLFYALSVRPAQLEQKIGAAAWPRCARLRQVAFIGMGLSGAGEFLFAFFPLHTGLPLRLFPGVAGWAAAVTIGLTLTAAASWIVVKVTRVAPDTFAPHKNTQMFGGMYARVRHPQAVADVTYWFAIGFGLNSPALILVALIWVPINIWLTFVEEKDLKLRFGQAYVDYMAKTGRFWPHRA